MSRIDKEISQSARIALKIMLDTILRHYLVKGWVSIRDEKICESTDVGSDAWSKIYIYPESCRSKTINSMTYRVLRNYSTIYTLLLDTKTSMNVYKSSVSMGEWSRMRQNCGFCDDLAMDSSVSENWVTCKVLCTVFGI